DPDTMPAVAWAGPVPQAGLDPAMVAALADGSWQCALLPEHATGWFGRPGLSGHRLNNPGGHPPAGLGWSAHFRPARGLHPGGRGGGGGGGGGGAGRPGFTKGGAGRGAPPPPRHTLTNTGQQPYVV